MIKKICNKMWNKSEPTPEKEPFRASLPADYISPQAIIDEYSVENLCEKAEKYFQNITDPFPFISRPFANFEKSPESLIALGSLLSGLRLGKTMKVLDFGAGVCWLSRLLNQMGTFTISVDCSKSALETGKKLFADYPIIGELIEEPQFLLYDGHHLDIENESVDRIICFDAFHHIPNTEEILGEFFRVLKDGGIAGFAEPGLCHSTSSQSQTEMRNYGVLENDICLDKLKELSERIGFANLYVKLSGNTEISYAEYREIVDYGVVPDRIQEHITIENRNRTIFFLQKGNVKPDSRNGRGLLCHIHLVDGIQNLQAQTGSTVDLQLSVENTGIAKWLHQNVRDLGAVKIGGHLFDTNRNLIELDFFKVTLENDVLPGETYDCKISFTAPAEAGKYIIAIDLVAEHICWFENCGSHAVFLDLEVV